MVTLISVHGYAAWRYCLIFYITSTDRKRMTRVWWLSCSSPWPIPG